jgi:hypothetical protein
MAQTRVPDDRKSKSPTAAEQREIDAEQDELLADMPALRPPHQLRLRHRNAILRIAVSLQPFVTDGGAGIDLEPDDPRVGVLLDVLADVDDFAESIALDKEAYIAWAVGAQNDHFMAILNRYASAVGE